MTLGNIVSGALFTGLALYVTYTAKPKPVERPLKELEMPAPLEMIAPSRAEVQ